MTNTAASLPRWDLSSLYPSPDSPAFAQAFRRLQQDVADLGALFDAQQVGQREPAPLADATVAAFTAVVARLNTVLATMQTMEAYLYALVSTDSRDAVAQAWRSQFEQLQAHLTKLNARFTAWVGSLDVEALIQKSPLAAEHAYPLRRSKIEAQHLLSPAEEALAAELRLTGSIAWEKLWGNVSSQIMVPLEREGKPVKLPMTVVRNLAFEPDRALRQRAYEAELAACQQAAVPLAAALNGVKGEFLTLARRRGWQSPLEAALFHNGIDRQILDTMLAAARDYFPEFRRYLRLKARALGLPILAWYDLFAPVGQSTGHWQFDRAAEFVCAQFGTFSPRLRELAARALRERWIDAEPRDGKQGGAYCMHVRRDESRVFLNYQPALNGVTTLAHELGHAYHNLNLAHRQPLQRMLPMVLAETASIFAERIVRQAALSQADAQEQLAILESELQGATQVVVDITSRLLFEQGVFERRAQRELSVDELNELMLQAQRDTYGDGLDQAALHPYQWAAKPHYYGADLPFYNFPYMFGLLFGLGIYARYEADPAAFRARYDDLLSRTGLADPATLAAGFGIDLRSAAFWRSSLDVLRADVDRFAALVGT